MPDPKDAPRRRKGCDWIVMATADGEHGFRCMRCGQFDQLPERMPVDVFAAWEKSFRGQHKHCEDKGRVDPPAQTVEEWARGFDTGISSKAIYRHMRGSPPDIQWGAQPPRDPSDFGRCHRLLQLAPEWRARIGEMAKYDGWARLAERWDDIEALYVEEAPSGMAPKCYALMKELERTNV